MPVPSVAWVDPTPASVDQDSPNNVTTWEARRQRQVFLKEVLYGTGSFVGNVPHRHLGVEDTAISTAATPNLVIDGCPDDNAMGAWTVSGYTFEEDKGFKTTTVANEYAWQILCMQAATSKAAMGAGMDITLSIFTRAKETTPSAGELHFGLADGGTTFKTGCKAVITAAMITSSHQRFYMMLDAATTLAWTTDCRFLIKNHSTAPNQVLLITAICANIGKQLIYWAPSLLESETNHNDWKRTGLSDCPIWDEKVAITDAVAIVGA